MHHQRGQCTRFDPSIHTVQQASRVTLDLDVIANIFPMESLGLSMNRCRGLHPACCLSQRSRASSLFRTSLLFIIVIARCFHVSWKITTTENEDLAFRLGSLDPVGRHKVHDGTANEDGNDDTQVSTNCISLSAIGDRNVTFTPPFVRGVVLEALVDVVISGNDT